ncbi:cysteine-rich receptor-like protein kinase 44 isoform X2 [Salvia miltiorrhiza]|uniref:cysteine-rich receptor-like protein kinase 44 isoform X2 n=1 Tax=Salvia miltiorrhiza TaxID=226208 RepID=UPI0025AC4A3B|nr:cysteine-rich receptor-like protein kinase 44 isoform X2 [Salvia miltiorrhiza]
MMSWGTWLLLILTNLHALARAQQYGCFGGNYTSNSTYAANLNSLLSSLPPNIDDAGFYNASSQAPATDPAYASALCRTDSQLNSCRACVRNATTQLLTLCSNRRQGVLFREACTLRYSDNPMYGLLFDDYSITGRSTANLSSSGQFGASVRALLGDLSKQAAAGGLMVKVAAGNSSASASDGTVFALVQCTPDLSSRDCSNCLAGLVQRVPGCCNGSTFVIMFVPSCTLRFQLQPFYNLTRIQQVQAMVYVSPPPAPGPPVVPSTPSPPPDDDEDISTVESLVYDFTKVKAATNDFSNSNKLGEGGFGVVYKGKLEDGREIAVKRLSENSVQGDREFKNEVLLMAKLQHRNLVRLLGFSLHGTERLLIYEFVANGSLDRFIFDPIKHVVVDWHMRYKIIRNIAKGLVYLHNDSGFRIIHRDLKAGNILLDAEMNPKIADFGMARLFLQDESGTNTRRIVGTFGYMAPEYARHGQISVKLDVFSFGVLMLEIVSGQRNGSFRNADNEENVEYMLSFAWAKWQEGAAKKIIDPVLMSGGSGSVRDMLRCIHIGLLCVQENGEERPTMASVVVMLSSVTVTLPMPCKPAYFMRSSLGAGVSKEMDFRKSCGSQNDASITELYPR